MATKRKTHGSAVGSKELLDRLCKSFDKRADFWSNEAKEIPSVPTETVAEEIRIVTKCFRYALRRSNGAALSGPYGTK